MSFTFKQFHIDDEGCGQPVSQDAVLLGAWAAMPDSAQGLVNSRILDIGTGSGLLALMAAQRAPGAEITALELDAHAATIARANVAASPWAERVEVSEGDISHWQPGAAHAGFDAIICNPPWFTSGLRAGGQQRAQARHQDSLTLELLLERIACWLSDSGQASLLLPTEESAAVESLAARAGLVVQRRCLVETVAGRAARRELLGLGFDSQRVATERLQVRDSRGELTPEFIALTQDFYLKL